MSKIKENETEEVSEDSSDDSIVISDTLRVRRQDRYNIIIEVARDPDPNHQSYKGGGRRWGNEGYFGSWSDAVRGLAGVFEPKTPGTLETLIEDFQTFKQEVREAVAKMKLI